MKRTRRLALIKFLLAGLAVGAVACGGSTEAPPDDPATDASVETISLKIEGMT